MRDAFARAEHLLSNAGASVTMLELSDAFLALVAAQKVILFREGRATFLNLYRAHKTHSLNDTSWKSAAL